MDNRDNRGNFGGGKPSYNGGGGNRPQNGGGGNRPQNGTGGGGGKPYGAPKPQPLPISTDAKPLPENYVDEAQKIMKSINNFGLTTSKIRSILSLISDIYNRELSNHSSKLTQEDASRLQMARVRIAYEAGRDGQSGPVYEFIQKTNILAYLRDVGDSRAKFIAFARYMEALVAFHRFYGGKA